MCAECFCAECGAAILSDHDLGYSSVEENVRKNVVGVPGAGSEVQFVDMHYCVDCKGAMEEIEIKGREADAWIEAAYMRSAQECERRDEEVGIAIDGGGADR